MNNRGYAAAVRPYERPAGHEPLPEPAAAWQPQIEPEPDLTNIIDAHPHDPQRRQTINGEVCASMNTELVETYSGGALMLRKNQDTGRLNLTRTRDGMVLVMPPSINSARRSALQIIQRGQHE